MQLPPASFTEDDRVVNVLFVCLGNICRSPTAEGVFHRMIEAEGLQGRVRIDSAGIAPWQIGRAPDPRAVAAARRRGIELTRLRARQVGLADFDAFDYLIAMDRQNLADLAALCPPRRANRLHLLLAFAARNPHQEVPDPFYGGEDGFEAVLDLIESGSRGLLDHLRGRDFFGADDRLR